MIFSKLHFHSGAKRCVPCCVTWPKSRWVSPNFHVIVTLLTLCFHKSPSWGCLRELRRDLHLSTQLALPLTKKHIIFSSTHKHFSSKTHKTHTAKDTRVKVNQLWKVWEFDLNLNVDPCTYPASGRAVALSKVLIMEISHNIKLANIHIRSDFLWLSSKFLKTGDTEANWPFKLYIML